MILVIDNYDSFTYNLVQYLGEMGQEVKVIRNDDVTVEDITAMGPDYILISPGPCTPDEAGVSLEVVSALGGKVPILGVCLGHQYIGQAFGGRVVRAREPVHGKTSEVIHDGKGIYRDLPGSFTAARYHSLVLERESLPECLEVTAQTSQGEVMGVRHRELPVEGVQFHPESIMTREGKKILKNFLGF